MKNLHLKHVLTPLLLALAVSQAYAVDITRTGANGTPGARGATDDDSGTAGGAGSTVRRRIVTSDAVNRLTLNGGHGGDGGSAGTGLGPPAEGALGGAGGAGGEARGRLLAQRASGDVAADVLVRGGNGGNGGSACCSPWATAPSAVGAIGSAIASAATGNGNVRVQVRATGGTGGEVADGGAAFASGTAAAINGVATGDVLAIGGGAGAGYDTPGPWNMQRAAQGDATANLAVRGSGPASGRSVAMGRVASANLSVRSGGMANGWSAAAGDYATATLALHGAGGTGTSTATGLGATSSARADTSGRALVDLTALAQTQVEPFYSGASSAAEVMVDSGYSTRAAGNAAITGKALAGNAEYAFGTNTARVTLLGSGDIVGISEAKGGDSRINGASYSGSSYYGGQAESFASGITRGNGNVTITSLAVGGKSMIEWEPYPTNGGDGSAVASGQSGSGKVNVKAEAHSYGYNYIGEPFSAPQVRASATTTQAGGTTYAEARHVSGDGRSEYAALAEASSVGSGGARAVASGVTVADGIYQGTGGTVESRATASGGGVTVSTHDRLYSPWASGTATSAANVGGVLYALPASADTNMVASHATGLPSSADTAALLADSPLLAAVDARWIGAGGMGYSNVAFAMGMLSDVQYSFATGDGQHLLLGLFGAQGVSSDGVSLDFSVSNQGVPVFSGYFYGSALTALLSDRLIDLGGFGAGLQNLTIATRWYGSFDTPSAYSFQYLVGVTPVPESSTWLAMLLGLGTLVMVARRRRV